VADQTNKRKIIELGETPHQSYEAGPDYSMAFSVDEIDVSKIQRHVLANVGLLLATLYNGEEEVVQVSMVTQVSPDGGELIRSVFSPLD